VKSIVDRPVEPTVFELGPLARIPLGEGRIYVVGDRQVAVFRTRSGDVFATQAWCPHERGPLADGLIGGGRIICPLHAYRFDLASGRPLGNDCTALRTYPISVDEHGELILGPLADGMEGAA
jgi:nitrite reductase (NADH) small subunit